MKRRRLCGSYKMLNCHTASSRLCWIVTSLSTGRLTFPYPSAESSHAHIRIHIPLVCLHTLHLLLTFMSSANTFRNYVIDLNEREVWPAKVWVCERERKRTREKKRGRGGVRHTRRHHYQRNSTRLYVFDYCISNGERAPFDECEHNEIHVNDREREENRFKLRRNRKSVNLKRKWAEIEHAYKSNAIIIRDSVVLKTSLIRST